MTNPIYYYRDFLNPVGHGNAFIEAEVAGRDEYLAHHAGHARAELTIADCNRIITLDFSTWGDDGTAKMREKIIKFRGVVIDFAQHALDEYDRVDEELARRASEPVLEINPNPSYLNNNDGRAVTTYTDPAGTEQF